MPFGESVWCRMVSLMLIVQLPLFARAASTGVTNVTAKASENRPAIKDLLDENKLEFLRWCDSKNSTEEDKITCNVYRDLTILLVKDHNVTLELVKEVLEKKDFTNENFCKNLSMTLEVFGDTNHPTSQQRNIWEPLNRPDICIKTCFYLKNYEMILKPICRVLLWEFHQLQSTDPTRTNDSVTVPNSVVEHGENSTLTNSNSNPDNKTKSVPSSDPSGSAKPVEIEKIISAELVPKNLSAPKQSTSIPVKSDQENLDEKKKLNDANLPVNAGVQKKDPLGGANSIPKESVDPPSREYAGADQENLVDEIEKFNESNIQGINGSQKKDLFQDVLSPGDTNGDENTIYDSEESLREQADDTIEEPNKEEPIPVQQHSKQEPDGNVLAEVQKEELRDDPFFEETDSNFFSYFLFVMFACIVCYVAYHNKAKLFALVLEGRRNNSGRGGFSKGRKHTAAYRKLDSNLEEAITSSATGNSRSTSQIIY
ncbi:trans-Golgi network integral membrane protein TGN38-like isoform X1 [Malaya genurostris]|uniref:trans-Golgi network integral membrane protein TGN38-like isoform X1 n=1 Tax=Malaya genurostris TaxID=325434 RepID=UPI0026F3C6F3|nr:trans-Golgi network integral membrane protein TGN38-like isoform X1 [Malaya genurostris]